eukprot:7362040-Alexandrium_andersonii.AAC.5
MSSWPRRHGRGRCAGHISTAATPIREAKVAGAALAMAPSKVRTSYGSHEVEPSPNCSELRAGPAFRRRSGRPTNPEGERVVPRCLNSVRAAKVGVVGAPSKEVTKRRRLRNAAFTARDVLVIGLQITLLRARSCVRVISVGKSRPFFSGSRGLEVHRRKPLAFPFFVPLITYAVCFQPGFASALDQSAYGRANLGLPGCLSRSRQESFAADTPSAPVVPGCGTPGFTEVVLALSLVVREGKRKGASRPDHAVLLPWQQGQTRGRATRRPHRATKRPGCCPGAGLGGHLGPCSGQASSGAATSGPPLSGSCPERPGGSWPGAGPLARA